MTPDQIYDDCVAAFVNRKFAAGLLVAFIDFFRKLDTPSLNLRGFDEFLTHFSRQETTAAGGTANTLIVATGNNKTLSIRPSYNAIENFFRAEHKRFDFPSCAPHATAAWPDYRHWLNALCTFSDDELVALRTKVCDFVLVSLPSHAFDQSSVPVEPPLFQEILSSFDITKKTGEKSGSAFQGIVFGFIRADNPHLQIEISKVRTGSKRLQRVGDVDAWEGNRLAISAEVKQYHLRANDIDGLSAFANETQRRSAIGIIFAIAFDKEVREAMATQGVQTVDLTEMQRIVDLWDSMKQRIAVASLIYYVTQVEKNDPLSKRLLAFIQSVRESIGSEDSD